jgi:hypothetical protein
MSKLSAGAVVASSLVTSLLFVFLFPPRRGSTSEPQPDPMGPPLPPGWEPAPSNIPGQKPPPFEPAPSNIPHVPYPYPLPPGPAPQWPEPPKPPLTPAMANILQGRRYKVTADLKPARNKGWKSAARTVMESPRFAGRFADMDLDTYDSRERPGVGDVTRLVFDVTPTVNDSFPLETEIPVTGAGAFWIVSIVEIRP